MSIIKEVRVPNKQIYGHFEAEIIEMLVKSGDTVIREDPLLVIESNIKEMNECEECNLKIIPSPFAGIVRDFKIKEGDIVSPGSSLLTLEVNE